MDVRQVAIRVRDLDRAVGFYEALTKTAVAARFDPPGFAFLTLGPTRLLLESGEASSTVYLGVEDVHAEVERLRSAGVVVASEPHVIYRHEDDRLGPSGTDEWMAFIEDTEGNLVGLVSTTPAG